MKRATGIDGARGRDHQDESARQYAQAFRLGRAGASNQWGHTTTRTLDRVIRSETITDPAALRVELQRVRRQGYAIEYEESTLGLRCIAARVIDRFGATTAAVSISGITAEFTDQVMPRYIATVVRAGSDIPLRLGSGTLAQANG